MDTIEIVLPCMSNSDRWPYYFIAAYDRSGIRELFILNDLEYEYYDKGTKESLIVYADSLTAINHPLGKLITLELEAKGCNHRPKQNAGYLRSIPFSWGYSL